MKTVSDPSGIGAPVKMRTARPGGTDPFALPPAMDAIGDRERRACGRYDVSELNRVPVDGGICKGRERHRRNEIVS